MALGVQYKIVMTGLLTCFVCHIKSNQRENRLYAEVCVCVCVYVLNVNAYTEKSEECRRSFISRAFCVIFIIIWLLLSFLYSLKFVFILYLFDPKTTTKRDVFIIFTHSQYKTIFYTYFRRQSTIWSDKECSSWGILYAYS